METDDCKQNTDVELYRETPGDHYSPSIHVTQHCGIGINVGGSVYVMPLRSWHGLAEQNFRLRAACEAAKELRGLYKTLCDTPGVDGLSAYLRIEEINNQLTAALESTESDGAK